MQKVFAYMEEHAMIRAGDKVIAGVSGGADSMCLFFVLLDYRRRLPFSLTVVHVEHGVRGQESIGDARFVEKICREHKIDFRLVSCQVVEMAKREKLSVEEAGRRARYEAFERIREELGADKIAVAHNQDDQAETVLFQIARGSGLTGAGGIRPVRGNIIRPLLCLSRAEIEAYLRGHSQTWRTDATNSGLDYARNRIRHQILPVFEKEINSASRAHIAALAQELQRVQAYMEQETENCLCALAVFSEGEARLDAAALREKPVLLQEYALRESLRRAGCPLKDIGRRHIADMQRLLAGQSGRRTELPGGWQAERSFDKLILRKRSSDAERFSFAAHAEAPGSCETPEGVFTLQIFPNENKNLFQNTYTRWRDCDKIGNNLFIRTRRPGDYIVVNRQGGKKKLKEYLIEEKIPAAQRDHVLLLAQGSEILWVIGHRISEAYRVSPETKRILEIRRMGENDVGENQRIDSGRGSGQKD